MEKNRENKKSDIILKALKDSNFKKRLLENPKETIEKEFNIQIPKEIKLKALEDTQETRHIVIPYVEGELSEQELTAISGGTTYPEDRRYEGGGWDYGPVKR